MRAVERSNLNSLSQVGYVIVFALLYFIAGRIGFLLPFAGEIATLIWPASGLALAVLLRYGLHWWPGVTLGALLLAISNQHSVPLTIGVLFAHTLEVYVAAYLLRHWVDFDTHLETFADVFNLLRFGIILGPAIGATIGILSFAISPEGTARNYPLMWWHWWLAHAISLSVVTPLLLTWTSENTIQKRNTNRFEYLLVLGVLFVVSTLIFLRIDWLPIGNYPLGHVLFPFLLWLALRFEPQEVATAGLVLVSISIMGTVNGTGPFSRPSLDVNLVLLGTFVFAVVGMTLTLSSLMAQRRRDALQLEAANTRLEQHVLERTADLHAANQQLQHEIIERERLNQEANAAREQALQALEIKNQILANVSHDARTPLNVILLYTDLLRRNTALDDEDIHQKLDVIHLSSVELLGFINNFLDAARLQAAILEPTYEQIETRAEMQKTTKFLQSFASAKGLTFTLNVDDTMPDTLWLDTEWIKQIVYNLGNNAIKFTADGGVIVNIMRTSEHKWSIQVRDTGIGIPDHLVNHIFDPFWQVDGSSTRVANRGVGLGLSIVKQLVDALEGTIQVESHEKQGSIFTVTLPIKEMSFVHS